jgi:adenylate kinase
VGAALHPDRSRPCAVVMLGPPGAGKGTQARQISQKFGMPDISTGEILRDAVNAKTALGVKAQPIMEAGQLVPDNLMSAVVEERISKPDCAGGFILDGFPRNLEQAAFLDRTLARKGCADVLALYINVRPDVLVKRLSGRQVCPVCGTVYNREGNPPRTPGVCDRDGAALTQRKDDAPEVVLERLKEFERQTQPVIGHYRAQNVLREVDGNLGPQAVTEQVFSLFKKK